MGLNGSRWLVWSLNGLWCPKLVGKKVEQDWNRVWGIGTDYSDHLSNPNIPKFGPQGIPKWVKMSLYGI